MKRLALAVLAATVFPVAAGAQDHHHHHHSEPSPPASTAGTLARTVLTDHRGQSVTLPDGKVWVVTFFYGSCQAVCPLLLSNLAQVAKQLPPAQQGHVGFAAVSFDPEVDTPAKLKAIAVDLGLDQAGSHLLTAPERVLKPLFEAYHFAYQPNPAGGFEHANLMAVMDGKGRIVKHFYGLNPPIDQVLKTVERSR